MDTFTKEDEKVIQEASGYLRDLAFNFFEHQPFNKTIIDPYNDAIINSLPDILEAPVVYETNERVGIIEFRHVAPLPPFDGQINPLTNAEAFAELKKKHDMEFASLELLIATGAPDQEYDTGRLDTPDGRARLGQLRRKHNEERHKLLISLYSEVEKNWFTAAKARQRGESWLLAIYADIRVTEWNKVGGTVGIVPEYEADEKGRDADVLDLRFLKDKVNSSRLLHNTKTSRTKENVHLFSLPLMVGSAWDWLILAKVPRSQWNKYGECDLSPQCQFIINGNEKAFISQIKASSNEPRIILDNKTADKIPEKVCELRCSTISKKSNLIRIKFVPISGKTDIKGAKTCFITLPFMKDEQVVRGSSSKPKLTFNILWIFRFYIILYHYEHGMALEDGESNILMLQEFNKTLLDVCYQQNAKPSEISLYRLVVNELIDTVEHATKIVKPNIRSDEDFIDHMRSYTKASHTKDLGANLAHLKWLMLAQFMPQVVCPPYEYHEEINWKPYPKFTALVQMLVKYVKCYIGVKTIDDRDSLEEQQLATAGMEISVLIKKAFNIVKNVVRPKQTDGPVSIDALERSFHGNGKTKVTDDLITCFSTGNWGLKGGGPPRPGVVQMFESASMLSQWNMIRKNSIPVKKNSNIEKPRRVHHTSYGIYDPTNTPDSEAVGLVRSLCLSVYVTSDDTSSYNIIVDYLEFRLEDHDPDSEATPPIKEFIPAGAFLNRKPNSFDVDQKSERLPCYIDNIFFCYATEEVYEKLKAMKLRKELGYSEIYIRTIVDDWETVREIRIRTCGGRTMRPLLRVIDSSIPALEMYRRGERPTFLELWTNGYAEYVSPGEFQEAEVAMNYQHFVKGIMNGRKFTHIEMDPYMAMSIEVATQPYPQLNPNPRVLYYASMARQPLSVPFATYQTRQETEIRVLNYVHKPLVTTDVVKLLGLDQQPFGTMVYVAIKGKSATDEDATVWKKSFFDRGGMQGTIFNTYSVEAADTVPDPKDKEYKYSKGLIKIRYSEDNPRDEEDEGEWPFPEGFPKLKGQTNVLVKPEDLLVRYRVKQDEISEVGKLKLAGKRAGFVSFTDYSGISVQREQRVVVRFPHIPGEGDKFANRYAQKGVAGKIIPDEDMSYIITPTGSITPDVIFSPTSFTSRMTAGMNAEIWAGQALVACDQRRIVKSLIRYVMGMEAPELKDKNTDFWIVLDKAMVRREAPYKGSEEPQFQLIARIKSKVENEILKEFAERKIPEGEFREKPDPVRDIEPAYDDLIRRMEMDGWEESYGIRVSKNIGTEFFFVIDEDFISEIWVEGAKSTVEKVVLFSQLKPELAELWYMENTERLIPNYLFRNPQHFPDDDLKELADATAFRDPNYKNIYKALKDRGYSPKGQYSMIDGKTGQMTKATIFAGPCMWMQLRHLTDSKYQIRDQGSMSVASRSVAKGKAVGGAVRSGELSHSAMLAHGNMSYLTERFMTASDKYDALVCSKCGSECYKQMHSAIIKCETCGSTDIPHVLTLPYSGVRFMSLLEAAGVRPTIETKPDPRYQHNVIATTIFEKEKESAPSRIIE